MTCSPAALQRSQSLDTFGSAPATNIASKSARRKVPSLPLSAVAHQQKQGVPSPASSEVVSQQTACGTSRIEAAFSGGLFGELPPALQSSRSTGRLPRRPSLPKIPIVQSFKTSVSRFWRPASARPPSGRKATELRHVVSEAKCLEHVPDCKSSEHQGYSSDDLCSIQRDLLHQPSAPPKSPPSSCASCMDAQDYSDDLSSLMSRQALGMAAILASTSAGAVANSTAEQPAKLISRSFSLPGQVLEKDTRTVATIPRRQRSSSSKVSMPASNELATPALETHGMACHRSQSRRGAMQCKAWDEPETSWMEKRILEIAYQRSLNDGERQSIMASCPEIQWLAECASRCPLAPGWSKIEGDTISYAFEGSDDLCGDPPVLQQFARMAWYVLKSHTHPGSAENAATSISGIAHDAVRQARQLSRYWTGPHFDSSTRREYYYCQAANLSSWQHPTAEALYLALVSERLLQTPLLQQRTHCPVANYIETFSCRGRQLSSRSDRSTAIVSDSSSADEISENSQVEDADDMLPSPLEERAGRGSNQQPAGPPTIYGPGGMQSSIEPRSQETVKITSAAASKVRPAVRHERNVPAAAAVVAEQLQDLSNLNRSPSTDHCVDKMVYHEREAAAAAAAIDHCVMPQSYSVEVEQSAQNASCEQSHDLRRSASCTQSSSAPAVTCPVVPAQKQESHTQPQQLSSLPDLSPKPAIAKHYHQSQANDPLRELADVGLVSAEFRLDLSPTPPCCEPPALVAREGRIR
eukprot:TRINITY_DN6448_c0_g1_i2.p1 TRINITY_DN6448_c0_g1~~TRINITY_DN6448_c0_g1_i2.p1  ORF type:complete len:753 (-),score=121.72 TRINITY_DN6448_c0_g1_i2:25-2283(-)